MNGRRLLGVLWRRRWTAWIALVLVVAATGLWLAFAPRAYTATAQLSAVPQPALAITPEAALQAQRTLAALADSAPVLADARTGLTPERSTATLQHEVDGTLRSGTALIRITVEDSDRAYARDLANAIADALPRHDPSGGQLRITVAGRAALPTDFSSPSVTRAVLIGAGAAILLALAAALLREAVSGRVEDAGQVDALAGWPVLATLPRPADPGTTTADAGPDTRFRALRVALEFVTSDEPTHTVVVAPTVPDTAAAWLTVNLGIALAQVQHRVLIVDADFSDATRHPAFKSKGPGLADVLRGDAELADAVRPYTVSGVAVLPAGRLPHGSTTPGDLVEMHFHKALAAITDEVDLVLVNAAPLSESDDARVMAVGNALLLAVPVGRMRARALRELAAALRRIRSRVVGTVLLGRHA